MRILIADSGSTKTDWLIICSNQQTNKQFTSSGINPCLMSDETIVNILQQEVKPNTTTNLDRIHFYGAGCRPDQVERMQHLLTTTLCASSATVQSDLYGAAHALCGHTKGIVAILGTGSGSAVYDGSKFIAQTPSLGYILGDEGSGAVLGRNLLSDIFKGQLSAPIIQDFYDCYPEATISSIIEHVYRGDAPNRYLAQFTHFLYSHRDDAGIHNLIVNSFRRFITRNIQPYNQPKLAINCVGSIAAVFESELRKAAHTEGYEIGTILRSPIVKLADYWLEFR